MVSTKFTGQAIEIWKSNTLLLKDGFCAAVEGVAGGVVLVDVGEGYSQKAVLFL